MVDYMKYCNSSLTSDRSAKGAQLIIHMNPIATRLKILTLLYNKIEQCCIGHIVHSYQQYWTILLSQNRV